MRFRFIGDPNNGGEGPAQMLLYGFTFNRVGWTEVPEHGNETILRKLQNHTHFESDGVAKLASKEPSTPNPAGMPKHVPDHAMVAEQDAAMAHARAQAEAKTHAPRAPTPESQALAKLEEHARAQQANQQATRKNER